MPGSNTFCRTIRLYQSGIHPCAYLDRKSAKTLFVDPDITPDTTLYSTLIDQGFRRSGGLVYRPDCPDCRGCVSLRVPVQEFTPRRSQRRVWQRNLDRFHVREESVENNPEHYRLFERYISARHQDGSMANTTENEFHQFIASSWSDTRGFSFYHDNRLVAVAVSDILPQGLSAVYTFFDPAYQQSSPGVYTILWQIEECRQRNLPWLYLGYWIDACDKMAYKKEYLPHEAFLDDRWIRVEKE
ncbi:MAG: arginyltransferase [Sedimenticola sp.]|nr:arginyltransferase [Sedimenticola sp.]